VAEPTNDTSLELPHDPTFHRREWRLFTISWLTFLGLMAATALGVFGNGPLSHGRAGDPSGPLWVEYERFARFGASQRVRVHARVQSDGTMRFVVGHAVRDAFRITEVTPLPQSVTIVSDGIEYQFAARENGPIILEVQPVRRGFVEATIRSPEAALRFSTLIYP